MRARARALPRGLEQVDDGEDAYPHRVDEVPVPGRRQERKVLFRRHEVPDRRAIDDVQEDDPHEHVEAVETGEYWRRPVEVETSDGELLKAEVYIAVEDFVIADGRPRPWYLDLILSGARNHGLPEQYVKSIEELAR